MGILIIILMAGWVSIVATPVLIIYKLFGIDWFMDWLNLGYDDDELVEYEITDDGEWIKIEKETDN